MSDTIMQLGKDNDSTHPLSSDIDGKIAYHEEMENLAMQAGDFTKAEHHRKMNEIYSAIKEQQRPYKTPEQVTDEDYKVAPTSADENYLKD
jgi:hypothetical protein